MSASRKLGVGSSAASKRCSGEKISDCGSAICGQPANRFGVQNGDCPCANDEARKTNATMYRTTMGAKETAHDLSENDLCDARNMFIDAWANQASAQKR